MKMTDTLNSWVFTDTLDRQYKVDMIKDVYSVYIQVTDIETGQSARTEFDIHEHYVRPLIELLKGIKDG